MIHDQDQDNQDFEEEVNKSIKELNIYNKTANEYRNIYR